MAVLKNHRYVSVDNIFDMLVRNHRHINWEKGSVAEWCFECVTDEIGNFDSFEEHLGVELKVRQGRAELPCGIYRMLRIRNNGVRVNKFTNDGTYLKMNYRTGTVIIDYIGIPIIDGYPVIDIQSRQACMWYCVKKYYYPEYLANRLNQSQWADMQDNYNDALIEAKGSFRNKTMDELDRFQETVYTFVKTPGMDRDLINHGRDGS